MNSALYEGRVRHRRHGPVRNAFSYSVFMAYLDLAELDEVFRGRWLWSVDEPGLAQFRRRDHFGDPRVPLDAAVRALVERETGRRPGGPVRLLTQLRTFGFVFNPVSFYYCYDEEGGLDSVVSEVDNTPWGERYLYVHGRESAERRGRWMRFRFAKRFHVSPFMPMDHRYDWRFLEPGRRIAVHMDNLGREGKPFDADLLLDRREITGASLAGALARHPFMTGKVVAAIYWQALRLWLKRTPVFDHPPGGTLGPPAEKRYARLG